MGTYIGWPPFIARMASMGSVGSILGIGLLESCLFSEESK